MSGGDIFWVTDGERETVKGTEERKSGCGQRWLNTFWGLKWKFLFMNILLAFVSVIEDKESYSTIVDWTVILIIEWIIFT